jgi:DNA-binding NarL/FixJ family response regulator
MEHAAEILSGRELEIVRLRMEGYANREIAAGLGISEPRISQILHDVGQRLVMAGHIDPPTSTRRRRVYTMERTKKEKKRAALPVSG